MADQFITIGTGHGGSELDLRTFGTVSGAAKGAGAGYLVPTLMSDGGTVRACQVLKMTAPGMASIYIERVFGDTGTTTINVKTLASTNTVAGTHFTSVNVDVTMTDGQRDRTWVQIPILAIPQGFGIIAIEITGAGMFVPYAYIVLMGTGHVPGAKFLRSKGAGVNSAGDVSGAGTQISPYLSLAHACDVLGNGGGVIYCQDNATYKELISGDYVGMGRPDNVCTVQSPLIIVCDPDNVGRPTCDNGETSGLSNAQGITIAPGAKFIWIWGWDVVHGNITTDYSASSDAVGCVLLDCNIHDYKINGSNGAAVRFDHSSGWIIQDVYGHEIYSSEGSHTSNEYTAVPMGFHEGLQCFYASRWTACCNTLDLLEMGFFQKEPPNNVPNGLIKGNCFDRFQRGGGAAGNPIALLVAGGDSSPLNNVAICYNVHRGDLETASVKSSEMIYLWPDTTVGQSKYVDIWNNVSIGGEGLLNFSNTINVRVWNNIVQAATTGVLKVGGPVGSNISRLEYCDFNYVVGGFSRFRTHYGVGTITYEIDPWRLLTISTDNYIAYTVAGPDVNTIPTAVVPLYQDTVTLNYSWTGSLGLAGQYRGVGILTSVGREVWF